jgi:hypothetical protein
LCLDPAETEQRRVFPVPVQGLFPLEHCLSGFTQANDICSLVNIIFEKQGYTF